MSKTLKIILTIATIIFYIVLEKITCTDAGFKTPWLEVLILILLMIGDIKYLWKIDQNEDKDDYPTKQ